MLGIAACAGRLLRRFRTIPERVRLTRHPNASAPHPSTDVLLRPCPWPVVRGARLPAPRPASFAFAISLTNFGRYVPHMFMAVVSATAALPNHPDRTRDRATHGAPVR